MAVTVLATVTALAFTGLRLSPTVTSSRSALSGAHMQMPDIGKMGSKFMNQMGLGDDSGLSKEEQEGMEERLKAGEMSFDDFYKQVQVMQKAGNLQAMLKKGPFAGAGKEADAQLEEGAKKMKRYAEFIEVMDAEDRANPSLLIDEAKLVRGGAKPDRLEKLAKASGSSVEQAGQFITEFSVMRRAAVAFANGEDPNTVKEMMMKEQEAAAPPMNRAMRRMKAKKKAKAAGGGGGGFGRR